MDMHPLYPEFEQLDEIVMEALQFAYDAFMTLGSVSALAMVGAIVAFKVFF